MKSLRFWLTASFLPWLALQVGVGRAEPAWAGFPLGVALAAGLVVAVTVMHNEGGERQGGGRRGGGGRCAVRGLLADCC